MGEFKTVHDIKPDTRARAFCRQVRVMIEERQYISTKYNESYKHRGFARLEYDPECMGADLLAHAEELKTRDDDNGDPWLADIIQQRLHMLRDEERRAWDAYQVSQLEDNMKREKREQEYERAMERTRIYEEEQDKERDAKYNRLIAANAEIQVYAYNRRKRHEAKAKRAAMYIVK